MGAVSLPLKKKKKSNRKKKKKTYWGQGKALGKQQQAPSDHLLWRNGVVCLAALTSFYLLEADCYCQLS